MWEFLIKKRVNVAALPKLWTTYVNIYVMKRTTVYLPEEAELVLKKIARQTGRSQAELIREAIEQYIGREQQSLPRSVGMGASGRNDLSERDEELLWEEG